MYEHVRNDMKIWHIKTWGGGTPHYLVSAETKEGAWKMVEEEWRKKYNSYYVGLYQSHSGKYNYQTIDNLKEVGGLTTQTSLIIDINKD